MEQKNDTALKAQRAERMIQLGELYYRQLRVGQKEVPENVAPLLSEIAGLDMQIANLNGAYDNQNGTCPQCHAPINGNTNFCSSCGLNFTEYLSQFAGTCKCCNVRILKNQNFCEVCGNALR